MTKQQISDSGFMPDISFAPNRHHDLFGIGTAVAGGVQAIASITAAQLQANAAREATAAQERAANSSLDFQKNQWNTQQANQAPWLQAGKTALGQLSEGTAAGGRFQQGYGKTFDPAKFDPGAAFQAPDSVTMQNDPGYAFRLSEGQKALERSAAAKGTATGGAALKAASRYGQDYASNEYGNVYNRALNTYQTNFGNKLNAYNTNYNTEANTFDKNYNVWSGDTNAQYNRLAGLAGVGQTAVNQLSTSGNQAASNVANINSNLSTQIGNNALQAGNAYASGAVGVGNAINNSISNYQNQQLLQQILAQRNSGYTYGSV